MCGWKERRATYETWGRFRDELYGILVSLGGSLASTNYTRIVYSGLHFWEWNILLSLPPPPRTTCI